MTNNPLRRLLAIVLIVSTTTLGFVQTAFGAVISTQTVMQLEDRGQAVSRIQSQLAREDVRQALVQRGVDPAHATARVSALTDAEIAQLDRELANLPAGGDAGWVLLFIVMAVLIYLFATDKLKFN
jgi:hypothetical protein